MCFFFLFRPPLFFLLFFFPCSSDSFLLLLLSKKKKHEKKPLSFINSLHSVHEGEKPFELELAWICEANGRKFERVPADKVAQAEAEAKAALAESDMDD